jgi:ribulose kinase
MSLVIGIDGGTESIRAGVFDTADGRLIASFSCPYATTFPNPAWAEQNPSDWWKQLGMAVKGAVKQSGADVSSIKGLCIDTTCCTVCALDEKGDALRPALLWMDMRASQQADKVASCGDKALKVNSDGSGPVSAEWMIPKALWIAENDPEVWKKAHTICEYQDFINMKLTGRRCASVNNASVRWHYDVESGWPTSMLGKLGIPELQSKWPSELLTLGSVVGGLSPEAAAHLGLPSGLLVAQGGADAFVGMLGLGVKEAGQMALLTGSSHLQLGLVAKETRGRGIFGSYHSALLPGE